jgi:hypothetical protein
MSSLTRRDFVRKTVLAVAATQLASGLRSAAVPVAAPKPPLKPGVASLHWLDGTAPQALAGATWGVSWPQGQHARGTGFALRTEAGGAVPVQSWPLAFWPDGSLKWTGHALPADAPASDAFELVAGSPAAPAKPLTVQESAGAFDIDTGVMQCRIARSGDVLIQHLRRDGREIARDGRLVCQREDRTDPAAPRTELFAGSIAKVTVEQSGPVRAVVKIEGGHSRADRRWLPFVVRLYFYAGGDAVRMIHTIVYDGDPRKDFIGGLGVRFAVPLRGPLYDRHVRFSGQVDGLFAEAVRGLTGLRRDPGAAVKEAQLAGRATPPLDTWPKTVSDRLDYIPAFGDWTLFQSSSDGFEIRKRTGDGFTWLSSARGSRAGGLGYVGTPDGGLAFGLRNFWQSHPAQLDIRGATGDAAGITAWLWAPEARPMDLRPYHDGMGEDSYAKQVDAMEITYEDYEPGFDSPEGVARTSELFFWALPATSAREKLVRLAEAVRQPPVLVTSPEYLHACGVFGGLWSPVDRSTPALGALEDQLDWHFKYYQGQQGQRRWYGFWNYGDVMHTYDGDRHEWRYDVGGFAWDNSELSTDLWLWLYFLRTGRADVFRFAEAMTRHTGEVDVHHLGRFAPLGSRHNVLHWGCSAKQLRISNAANRRYYYYLTADERVGDLMREQVEAARALVNIQPNRKAGGRGVPQAPDATATHARIGFGTDWGALSAAWLTEWERTGDAGIRDRLRASMSTIGRQPRGFFSSGGRMNLATGEFDMAADDRASASHLSAVFGLVEVCAELLQLLDVPGFRQAWLDYCELYNAPAEEQTKRLGRPLTDVTLRQGHSRLTAFAAKTKGDAALAQRAWREFFQGEGSEGRGARPRLEVHRVVGPAVLQPVDEAVFISTNGTAQWGLAAIQNLALVGSAIPST